MKFTKGNKLSGSRKGIQNKISTDLREMVLRALSDEGGVEYLRRMARQNKTAFGALLGKCLPKNVLMAIESPRPVTIRLNLAGKADN